MAPRLAGTREREPIPELPVVAVLRNPLAEARSRAGAVPLRQLRLPKEIPRLGRPRRPPDRLSRIVNRRRITRGGQGMASRLGSAVAKHRDDHRTDHWEQCKAEGRAPG